MYNSNRTHSCIENRAHHTKGQQLTELGYKPNDINNVTNGILRIHTEQKWRLKITLTYRIYTLTVYALNPMIQRRMALKLNMMKIRKLNSFSICSPKRFSATFRRIM